MRKSISEFLRRRGSIALLWLLIAVILASPLADAHPSVGALLAFVLLVSVLAGASLPGNRRIVRRIAIPLSGVWILARFFEEFGNGRHAYNHLAHFAGLALSSILIWAMFDRIQDRPQVASNVIAEAAIAYLIIAIAFSQVYWILNGLVAHPFNQALAPSQGTSFLYFSLVTLTAVGYGGILPINPYVRLVAGLESMSGIFYVAVIVARLVSSRK